MTEVQIDERVLAAAPVLNYQLDHPDLAGPLDELRESIMASEPAAEAQLRSIVQGRKSFARPVLVAASVLILIVAAIAIETRGTGRGSSSAHAAELVAFAEESPRILIDSNEWSVTRADENTLGGEMTFSSRDGNADLQWRAESLASLIESRLFDNSDLGLRPVLDTSARVVLYEGGDFTALWEQGGTTIEFRASSANIDSFAALLSELHVVDTDPWLNAMPPSVIDRANRAAAVNEILADIPLPPNFIASELDDAGGVTDQYQLKAQVTGAAACAWLDQWFTATETDDSSSAAEASAMLATSHQWRALLEIADEGGWSKNLWEWADAVNGGPGVSTGNGPQPPTRAMSIDALGCTRHGG